MTSESFGQNLVVIFAFWYDKLFKVLLAISLESLILEQALIYLSVK